MNKRELKALCSLTQKSIDELVESKNIDLRHSQPVSMDAEIYFGSDMPAGVTIIIRGNERYFDAELNEYFMADDDRKLHPISQRVTRNICIGGTLAERPVAAMNIEHYALCPFACECRCQLDIGCDIHYDTTDTVDYEGKKLCRYAAEHFMKTCSICGEKHPVWNIDTVEGKPVCNKCLESEVYARCEVSGERFLRSKGHMVDGLLVSPKVYQYECAKDEVFTGEIHLVSNMAKLPDGNWAYIPAIEASGNYAKCSHCGKYHLIDQITTDADGYNYCSRCVRAAILPYHSYREEYKPKQMDGENAEVFFGIELELAGNPINAHLVLREMGDIFHCESDASIDSDGGGGFEIISQPMSWNYLKYRFPEIKTLFRKLSGRAMRGHDTSNCGLHVHVTRSYFKKTVNMDGREESTAELFADALVNESFAENIQTFARRRSSCYYAYSHVDGLLTKEKSIRHWDRAEGHGVSVNFANSKTVEFRMFKSTLNPETYISCVEFVKNIAEMANRMATTGKRVVYWSELVKGEYIPNYVANQVARYGKRYPNVRFDAQSWNIEEVKRILKYKRDFIKNLKFINDHSIVPVSLKTLKKAGIF
ncbi:MAG: hypothetical protein Q4B60_08980 [Erysipelotrichaceae bacterium]|nr:hypothetical protein [Erysipelotrichaceae bacterium]